MTAAQVAEVLGREIYWAAYDQYLGPTYKHPLGFTQERAWNAISETQRQYCIHQGTMALAAMIALGLVRKPA